MLICISGKINKISNILLTEKYFVAIFHLNFVLPIKFKPYSLLFIFNILSHKSVSKITYHFHQGYYSSLLSSLLIYNQIKLIISCNKT